MRGVLVGAAALILVGTTVPVAAAAATTSTAPAAVVPAALGNLQNWHAGVRAGSTKFTSGPGATCQPKVAKKPSDTVCMLTFSGRFTGTDQGYHGTYAGTATVRWLDPAENTYAAFESGGVTYTIYDAKGTLLGTPTLRIDLGTGGINGFPFDLTMGYTIEERTDVEPGLVIRMSGTGINQLDKNLNPVRVFTDRIGFQNGI